MKRLKLMRKSLGELVMSMPAIGKLKQQGFIGGNGSPLNPWTYSGLICSWLAENRYGNGGTDVSTPWCAAFVSSMLSARGISNPKSCTVSDFKNWGTGTTSLKVGDVAIFNYPSHVGIVAAVNDNSVTIISGNSRGPGDATGNTAFVTSKTYYGLDDLTFRTY